MGDLKELAEAVKHHNATGSAISRITDRPANRGSTGEYIAAQVLGIELHKSAATKDTDGYFSTGPLKGSLVNIKWYAEHQGLLDINPAPLPAHYYLVMAGPKAAAVSSRGKRAPWTVTYVFLFERERLLEALRKRGVKIGIATSVSRDLWNDAEIYPAAQSSLLVLTEEQKALLGSFG